MYKLFFLELFFLLMVSVKVCAQDHMLFNSVYLNNSTSVNSTIQSLTTDDYGHLWIGSNNGLIIFDGKEIQQFQNSFNKEKYINSSLLNSNISSLVTDSKGFVYAKASHKLLVYNQKKDSLLFLSDCSIEALTLYKDSLYFISDHKLYCYDVNNHNSIFKGSIVIKNVKNMKFIDNGSLWLTTNNECFFYSSLQSPPIQLINDDNILSIVSGKNTIWVATEKNGIYKFKGNSIKQYDRITDSFKSIAIDLNNNLWAISSNGGLYYYEEKNDSFNKIIPVSDFSNLIDDSFKAVYVTKSNNILLVSLNNKVYIHNALSSSVKFYTSQENNLNFSKLLKSKDGTLWMLSKKNTISFLDTSINSIKNYSLSSESSFVDFIYDPLKDQFLLKNSLNNFFIFNCKEKEFKPLPIELNEGSYSSQITIKGNNFFYTSEKRIYKYDLNTSKSSVVANLSNVKRIVLGDNNFLWVLQNNRIVKINTVDLLQPPIILKEFDNNVIGTIFYPYDKNHYILDINNKLYLFNISGTLKEWSANNFKTNYVYSIFGNDSLYISTDEGLYVLNKQGEVLHRYSFFNTINLFNISFCLLPSDQLFFTNSKYLASLPIHSFNKIKENTYYFSHLYCNNKEVFPNDFSSILSSKLCYAEKIFLPYDKNNMSLSVAIRNWETAYEKELLYYQLEGIDKKPLPLRNFKIVYTNLPSGNFLLKLMKKNNDNTFISINNISINVASIWYETWWARLLEGIFIILLLVLLYIPFYHKKRIKEEENRIKDEQRKSEERLVFFTNISHEFRTPLALMSAQIELLLSRQSLSNIIYQRMIKILEQVHYMNNLITELLEFRTIEKKQLRLKVKPLDITFFIYHIWESFIIQAQQKEIKCSISLPSQSVMVWVDENQLIKVVNNLLSNAYKYTPSKGKIELSLLKEEKNIVLLVSNTGEGISKEKQKSLFERFITAHNNSFLDSFGIGLNLTKEIIEIHGGSISVESDINALTTFKIVLPLGKEHFLGNKYVIINSNDDNNYLCQCNYSRSLTTSDTINVDSKEHTLLIVDDNKEFLDLITEVFNNKYVIITAHNGEEALSLASQEQPDVIISDVMMPIMNGFQLCKSVKNNIEISHIPVILLTALKMIEYNIQGLEYGADDYIVKPFNIDLIQAKVKNIILSREELKNNFKQKMFLKNQRKDLKITSIDKKLFEKVDALIAQNASNNHFNVEILASELAMSRSGLFSKFKSLIGITPNEFIRKKRLQMAAEDLKNNPSEDLSIIAERYTFCNKSYFIQCFKKEYGIKPDEFIS